MEASVRCVMAITGHVSSQRRNQFEIITSQNNEKRERVHPWTLLRFDGNENAQPREEVWSSIFWNSLKNKEKKNTASKAFHHHLYLF